MRKTKFLKDIIFFKKHILNYQTPINLSFIFTFGSLLGYCMVLQIASGIFLSFFYNSDTNHAFFAVENIMRNIKYGWFIRYLHVNVASFIFFFLYIHMGKALYFRSYTRMNLWLSGWAIFIVIMLQLFLGMF